MPIHDWTKVDAGIFHAFACGWWSELARWWNANTDPDLSYALIAPAFGSPSDPDYLNPPAAEFHVRRRQTVVIHSAKNHTPLASIEIISPGVKQKQSALEAVVQKVRTSLRDGIQLLVIDLFPPGPHEPQGLHSLIWSEFSTTLCPSPVHKPLTLAAYVAGEAVRGYVESLAVGDVLTDMPLFLTRDLYVSVPLEATYAAAWATVPRPWREVLEPPIGG